MSNGPRKNILPGLVTGLVLVMSTIKPAIGTTKKDSSNKPTEVAKSKLTSPTTKQTALEFVQVHAMGGPQRVLFSKDGLRLENQNTGIVIVSEAPFTKVAWCNPKKKLFYRISAEKSMKRMNSLKLVLTATNEFTEIPFEPPKETTLLGRPALMYAKHTPKKSWLKYWVLKEPKVQDMIKKHACNFSGSLPELGGIPLQWHQLVTKADMFNEIDRDQKPEVHDFFVTKSVKELTVPHSVFTCPSDYTETKDRDDVMSSSVGFGSYKDLIESPDFLFQSSSKKLNSIPKDYAKRETAKPNQRQK